MSVSQPRYKEDVRVSPEMRRFILCVDAYGQEHEVPVPDDPKNLAPTLALLRSALGHAQVVLQRGDNKRSRMGA